MKSKHQECSGKSSPESKELEVPEGMKDLIINSYIAYHTDKSLQNLNSLASYTRAICNCNKLDTPNALKNVSVVTKSEQLARLKKVWDIHTTSNIIYYELHKEIAELDQSLEREIYEVETAIHSILYKAKVIKESLEDKLKKLEKSEKKEN